MQLREATPADCPILSALHTACFPRGWGVLEFASFYERDGIVAYIAEQNGEPAGFVFCWVVAGECELLSLAVLESHRRQGVAKQLLMQAVKAIKAQDASKIHLEVNIHNKAAQALYQAQDFTITARRKDYYTQADGTRADAVTMKLRLD